MPIWERFTRPLPAAAAGNSTGSGYVPDPTDPPPPPPPQAAPVLDPTAAPAVTIETRDDGGPDPSFAPAAPPPPPPSTAPAAAAGPAAPQVESVPLPRRTRAPVRYRDLSRDYSVIRAVAAAAGMRRHDGLEREVGDELRRRTGRDYEGLPVPLDALSSPIRTREVTTTTPTAGPGSRIVPEDYRPQDYIPLLRDALVTRRLGVRTLSGLVGDVGIPKAKSGVSGGWAAEGAALPVEDLSLDPQIVMSPKKAGVVGSWSARMFLQSSPDIEQLFRADMSERLARVLDTAILEGAGTSSTHDPEGIITAVSATPRTGDTNGLALSFAQIQALQLKVDSANVGMTSRAFLLSHAVKAWGERTVKFADVGSDTIFADGMLLGVPAVVSEIAPTKTKGSLSDAPTLIYGNWSDAILGTWQDLDLMVNPYETAAFRSGSIAIRAMLHADVALRYAESFAWYDGVKV